MASGIVLVSVPALAGGPANLELDALWVVACLSALGGLLGSVAARRGAAPARRAGMVVLVGLVVVFVLLRAGSRGPTWVDAICPLWLDPDDGPLGQSIMIGSLFAWGSAALLSLAIMLRVRHGQRRETAIGA